MTRDVDARGEVQDAGLEHQLVGGVGLDEDDVDARVALLPPAGDLVQPGPVYVAPPNRHLLVGEAGPKEIPTVAIGLTLIWIAAALTIVTGYDYLRTGLRHMADDIPPGGAE